MTPVKIRRNIHHISV